MIVMANENPMVSGEYLIPPSEIYKAIDRAAHHHAEMVDAQIAAVIARLDAMDRERARLYVIVQDELPAQIAHALNEGVAIVRAEMATILQRIDDMDRADALLRETVSRVPTELQREIAHVRERMQLVADDLETKIMAHAVLDIKSFESVDLRFSERDKRFEIQATDNQTAIDKAERSTSATIDKNAQVTNEQLVAVRESLGDLKDRVVILESLKRGAVEERVEHRAVGIDQRAMIALGISVILALIGVVGFIIAMVERAGSTP